MPQLRASLVFATLLLCSATVIAQGSNTLTAQEKSQGWQLLFDGKTLKGWHSQAPPARGAGRGGRGGAQTGAAQSGATRGGTDQPARAAAPAAPAPGQTGTPKPCTGAKGDAAAVAPAGGSHWEVVDGQLIGCGEPAGYLTSDRSFRNFVLSLDFKCSADTNSGVFIRSPQENGGYEVQIWRQQPAGYNTGAIVGTAKTARDYSIKGDDWNHFQITADGDHIVVVLNGETTLDVRDSRFAEGNIRLQYQMYPTAFRNIKIRELP
jgi:hypothetical protein